MDDVGQSREPAPTTPDPIEIAMEAEAHDRSPDSPARRLLVKQERLVGWQIASERAGFALKMLTGLVGLALAAVLSTLVWQAAHARGLVVAPFSVPPELSARGLTGEVVASQVLDKLAQMQEQTATGRRGESTAGDWGRDLKVVIPSTGVSLGDLQNALRQWLGHETRVSGEVYRTPAGAVLSVRLAGHPAFQASGDEQNLDALAGQVAEQIMKATQPYRYGIWLQQNGRGAERGPLLEAVAASNPDERERAWAWRGIGREAGAAGDWPAARAAALHAIALRPKLSWAWDILNTAERAAGHAEAALAADRKVIALTPSDQDLEPWARDPFTNVSDQAEDRGDFTTALAVIGAEVDPRLANVQGTGVFSRQVRNLVGLHRLAEVRAKLAEPHEITTEPWAPPITVARWRLLFAAEDWPALIAMAGEQDLPGRGRLFGATSLAQRTTHGTIQLAYARMVTGDLAGAGAILDSSPLDCDRCLIGRGQLAAARGDAAEADRWFRRAVDATPSLPQAAFEWGLAKLARGDQAGAIALFRRAHKLGPAWAEPLKFEGDALMAQSNADAAQRTYAQAAEHAPRWGGLRLAWGKTLAKLGRTAEAKAQFTAAAGMDLTVDERAELARVQGAK